MLRARQFRISILHSRVFRLRRTLLFNGRRMWPSNYRFMLFVRHYAPPDTLNRPRGSIHAISFCSALNSSVPAFSSHSKITISVVTMAPPARSMRVKA